MNNLHLYHKVLRQICQWQPQERITRCRNAALLIVGLHLSGAVYLPHITRKWPVLGKASSLVNRLRRFLNNERVAVAEWYRPVAQQVLKGFAGQTIRLIIDCTKVGFNHRMLMVSVAYRKRSLPLVWRVYRGSKGHIGHQEQIALLKMVKTLLPPGCQVEITADAGFESVNLLDWLSRQHWYFVIRLPGRTKIRSQAQDWVKLNQLGVQEGQTLDAGWVRLTQQHDYGWVYLVIHWAKGEDEPWYLVSNRPASARHIIRMYKRRMWIEEMFGDMKGHGFDLETTHLDDPDRISRLVLGVCIAYVWLIALGSWVVKSGYRHLIDLKSRRDKSYFRLGWDWLERCLLHQTPIPLRFTPIL